jgi:hypothetical protein
MHKLIFLVCMFVVATSTAEARHRHRHWHGYHFGVAPYAYGFVTPEKKLERQQAWRESVNPEDTVPPNWQLRSPDSNWKGKRFLSPDGSSWLAVYASPTTAEPIEAHMQSVAFAEDESLTHLRGERDWIAVSGMKGDRIFYRQAIIACGRKVWHHIAFEYPADRKRAMDPFVIRAATILDHAENDGCEEATSLSNPVR